MKEDKKLTTGVPLLKAAIHRDWPVFTDICICGKWVGKPCLTLINRGSDDVLDWLRGQDLNLLPIGLFDI